ncbi:PD-(D/E)XK nuclease family protein [Planctomycetota bacterium]
MKTLIHGNAGPDLLRSAIRLVTELHGAGTRRFLFIGPGPAALVTLQKAVAEAFPPGFLGFEFQTFFRIVDSVLEQDPRPYGILTAAQQQIILEAILRSAGNKGRLLYYTGQRGGRLAVSELLRFIAEFKNAEVTSDELKAGLAGLCQLRQMPKLHDVLEIYSSYQTYLIDHDLYDREGSFWQAKISFRHIDNFQPLAGCIVVAGFSDFTSTQLDLLKELSRCHPHMIVTLPYGADPDALPFASAMKNIRAFEEAGDFNLITEPAEAQSVSFCDTSILRPELTRISFMHVTGGITAELRDIAARIKTLILEGADPERIALGLPNFDEHRLLLWQVFEEFGIPLRTSVPIPQVRSLLWRRLRALASCRDGDFSREDIQSFYLTLPTPDWDLARVQTDSLLAGIRGGKEEWLKFLKHRMHTAASTEIKIEYQNALRDFKNLLQLARSLPETKKPRSMLQGIMAVLAKLAIPQVESDILERILTHLSAQTSLDPAILQTYQNYSLPEMLELQHELLFSEEDILFTHGRGVHAGRLQGLLGLEMDYLFLGQLQEQALPLPRNPDRLLEPALRQELISRGLALVDPEEDIQRDAFLLSRLFCNTGGEITLSCCKTDDNGDPLKPSIFFEELQKQIIPAPPVPQLWQFNRRRIWRYALQNSMLESGDDLMRGKIAAARAQAALESKRQRQPGQGQFSGRILDKDNLELLGPGQRSYSAGRFNSYRQCPFYYFAGKELNIDEIPELPEDIGNLESGSILHTILQIFFRTLGPGILGCSQADISKVAAEIFDRQADKISRRLSAIARHRRDLNLARLREVFMAFVDYEIDQLSTQSDFQVQPAAFEVSFGKVQRDDSDPGHSVDEFLELENPGAAPIRISGSIDRVDSLVTEAGETVGAQLVDYKLGAFISDNKRDAGADLQLQIYLLAMMHLGLLGKDLQFLQARFESISLCDGSKKPIAAKRDDKGQWQSAPVQTAADIILQIVSDISHGLFPAQPSGGKCIVYCPYRELCRFQGMREGADA